ncbi:MAG: patatin-like phospholipase family protein, partial [Acetobacteraceae bacterium]
MHVIPHSQSTEPRAAPGGVALILQGSATLAAYQGGVAHALQEAGPAPYWAAGVSLGACYAALIAGNPPEHRIARISEFFSLATLPTSPYSRSLWSAWLQATLGATIGRRDGNPRLREILLQLVDFDRINRAETRLTLGATDPATGRFSRFDNSEGEITPEHVVAS